MNVIADRPLRLERLEDRDEGLVEKEFKVFPDLGGEFPPHTGYILTVLSDRVDNNCQLVGD